MKRKLVKHGEATMTISLPSKWLKKFNINKGDDIDIQEKENHLIIGVDEEKTKTEISLNITSLEESSIRTLIANAYRLGYDKMNIKFDNKEIIKIITEMVEKSLLGFEIIKTNPDSCTIESVTEPSREQFNNIFSKVILNTEELLEIINSVLNGKKQEFKDVDRKIQQYDNFCKRIIAKRGLYENNFLQWGFHSSFVHATRELYHLLDYTSKNKIKAGKIEIEMLQETKKIFELIKEAYLKKEIASLEKLHSLEKEATYKKGYNSLKKASDPVIIFHLMSALKHFYLANSPLVGMIIQSSPQASLDKPQK